MFDLFQSLSGFATDMSTDWNPVPEYREGLEDYEAFKEKLRNALDQLMGQSDFLQEYAAANGTTVAELMTTQGVETRGAVADRLKEMLRKQLEKLLDGCDTVFYDTTIHNFVYYFGVN